MANIFSLFGTIFVDNSEANKNIDTTTEKGEQAGSKLGKAFSAIGNAAVKMGELTVGAAAAVTTGVYKLASSTSEHADEIDKMSQKLGLSRSSYQEWDYVLSQAGVEITSMSTGLKTLTNKLDDAKNGSKKAVAMFNQLGLSMEELQGMSREDVFNAVIKSMQGMEDSAERAALANDLFGRSGQELTALFNSTAESTEELKQKAHDLGMVMTDDAVQAGVDLNDTLDTAKRSITSVKNVIGSAAIPVVEKFANLLIQGIPKVQKLFQNAGPVITKVFDGIVTPTIKWVSTIGPKLLQIIKTLAPLLQQMTEVYMSAHIEIMEALIPPLIDLAEQILPIIADLISSLVPIFSTLVQTLLPPLVTIIQELLPPLLEIIQLILPPIIDLLNSLLPIINDLISRILPILVNLIQQVMPLVIEIIQQLLPPIITLIQQLLPPITEIIKAVLPILIQLINNILPLVSEIIKAILPVLISLIQSLMPALKPVLDLLTQILAPITEILKVLLPPLMGLINTLFSVLLPSLQQAFKTVANVVVGPVKTALIAVKAVINTVKDALGAVIKFITDVFTGNWSSAWESVKNLFGSIFGGIVELFKAPINFIIDGLNAFINGLNLLQIPDWVPVVGGLGLHIPNIPKLRVGIDYVPHDDFLAYLHKGEQVLTAGEREDYQETRSKGQKPEGSSEQNIVVNVTVNIEKIENPSQNDIDELTEEIMEMIDEAIKRKGVVFS